VTDRQPWEEPGAVRRDCEPHRAALLGLIVRAGAPLALVSAILNSIWPLGVALGLRGFGPTGLDLAALPATAATWGLAGGVGWASRRDLALMRAGRMDPEGRAATVRVRFLAAVLAAFPPFGLFAGFVLLLAGVWLLVVRP
jgi:hypothetical protein